MKTVKYPSSSSVSREFWPKWLDDILAEGGVIAVKTRDVPEALEPGDQIDIAGSGVLAQVQRELSLEEAQKGRHVEWGHLLDGLPRRYYKVEKVPPFPLSKVETFRFLLPLPSDQETFEKILVPVLNNTGAATQVTDFLLGSELKEKVDSDRTIFFYLGLALGQKLLQESQEGQNE